VLHLYLTIKSSCPQLGHVLNQSYFIRRGYFDIYERINVLQPKGK
jgi:hypothetical protein